MQLVAIVGQNSVSTLTRTLMPQDSFFDSFAFAISALPFVATGVFLPS